MIPPKPKRFKRNRYVAAGNGGRKRTPPTAFCVRVLGCLLGGFLASVSILTLYDWVLRSPYFFLRGITLVGCEQLEEQHVIQLMNVDSRTSVLALDLQETAARIETEPWVSRALVRRELPDELWVRIWERKPLALLSLQQLYYLDDQGVPFQKVRPGDSLNYPVITGLGAEKFEGGLFQESETKERILLLLNLLEHNRTPVQSAMVSEIQVEGEGSLTLLTRDQVRIRLGTTHYSGKFRRLSEVMEDLNRRGHWRLIQSIDLDFEEQVVVTYRGPRKNLEHV